MRISSNFARREQKGKSRAARNRQTAILDNDNFSGGLNTYVANDQVAANELRTVQNARIATIGRYTTRIGSEYYSNAVGETIDQSETSTTGAANQTITKINRFAQPFTTGTAGRLTKVELNLYDDSNGTAPLRVDLYDDNSGEPGNLLAESSVNDNDFGGTAAYEVARFFTAPELDNATKYWLVVYQQDNASGDYKVTSTTNGTDALASTNSGATWSSTSYRLNYKTYMSTDSGVLGAFRAYQSGTTTRKTLFAHGTSVYEINDSTGAVSTIKTGLTAGGRYYFTKVNDIVYYVNGQDAPRKWDFTTESAVGGSPDVASNIILHKNQLFFQDATDPNKIFWSDIADYETFTSTNFEYIPSPKYNYGNTAWTSVNGILIIFNEREKWGLYGDDRGNFELIKLPGEKGTYTQETMTTTRNFVYFLSDDGVYRTSGSYDELISAKVTDIIEGIGDKSKCLLTSHKNRLYLYYPTAGSAVANACLVYNLDFETWESLDTDQYVGRQVSFNGDNDDNERVLFSNVVGQAFYADRSSANYSDVGKPIEWKLAPKYENVGEAYSRKQFVRWYSRYQRLSNSYNVSQYYDANFENNQTLVTTVSLVGSGSTWGSSDTWGGGATWGSTNFIDDRSSIGGNNKYIQIRYERKGANTPVELIGHTLFAERRRPR